MSARIPASGLSPMIGLVVLGLAVAPGCGSGTPQTAPDATVDARPTDVAATDALAADAPTPDRPVTDDAPDAAVGPVDVPVEPPAGVPRCGPGAVPHSTRIGLCAVNAPMPDGGAPAPGLCTAVVNSPAATLKANQMDGDALVIPSGRRISVAARRQRLSGFPMSILRIPGTGFLAVSDGGFGEEHLRVYDTTGPTGLSLVPGGDVVFPYSGSGTDPALFYGLAYDSARHVLYAAGGGADHIYAYTVASTGALTADGTHTIDLGLTETGLEGQDPTTHALRSAFPAGIALSDDGTELYAALQRGQALGVFSTVTRMLTHVIPFDPGDTAGAYPYVVARRPGDTRHVYVSLWGAHQVAEVDVTTQTVSRTFEAGKNPTEMLFSTDGGRLLVAGSDGDALRDIDLTMPSAPSRTVYVGGGMAAPRGVSPTALAWGPGNTRLYVVEADDNAVDVLDAVTLARVGRIPTEFFPTDVDVGPDGAVFVVTGRGIGSGPNLTPQTTVTTDLNGGSIARYSPPTDTSLHAGDATVDVNNRVMTTFNSVRCPAGTPYDFPIPAVGSTAPSQVIHHVILVIRENKTYDAVLGDWPGNPGQPADGNPALTLIPSGRTATVFPNLHGLVGRFASLDNYYIGSELSNQGHAFTTAGRNTDFDERTWMLYDGRSTRGGNGLLGTSVIGTPEEGDIFTALRAAGIEGQNWGEVVGTATAAQRVGRRYPGSFFNTGIPDITKARAFADWVQGTNNVGMNLDGSCELKPFTYILLPNDHTNGGAGGAPTPQSFYEDNDEATGYLIDAVSHSPFWPDTLIVVVEDDPAQGGDHVDNHRTIAVLASPWVARGRVSHVHYDIASVHHTIELILGMPPHNAVVAAAAPLYDAFTGTPDFTPYDYVPRQECATYNPTGGMWAEASSRMDFSQPDRAVGLDRLVWQMLHHGHVPPWAPSMDPDGDGDGD